jgi:hypothetical protein
MEIKYFTGIEFRSGGDEFKSKPSRLAIEAFEAARLGNSQNYPRVVLYAQKGDDIVEIPYSEVKHLEDGRADLSDALRKIAEEKFRQKV